MVRKLAVAIALAGSALVVAAPVASATGPGSGGAPGTTAPTPGTAPKPATPYYYAWYTSLSAADKVCADKLKQGAWKACAVQSKSGIYYVWFGL
jgi:hypothetical protein